MKLAELSTVLWRQRELLQLLLFKLEEEQLLLAAGRSRWLPQATREVEMVLTEISRTELSRAVHVEDVARELGLPADASLAQLAEHAPEPWNDLFAQHRRAFLEAVAEVTTVAQANRDLLKRGYELVTDTLRRVGGVEEEGYDANGRPARVPGGRFLVDGTV